MLRGCTQSNMRADTFRSSGLRAFPRPQDIQMYGSRFSAVYLNHVQHVLALSVLTT